jgi:hypothetical protein
VLDEMHLWDEGFSLGGDARISVSVSTVSDEAWREPGKDGEENPPVITEVSMVVAEWLAMTG